MPAVIVAIAVVWLAAGSGLVSSNDGSHVALARAFARGDVAIDEDVALTLWVDRAVRDGRNYSDRPPGTAAAAVPAAWIGARLDPLFWRDATERQRALVRPAATRYAETYTIRAQKMGIGVALATLQGTVLMIALHCALVGALGLVALDRLLRLHGVSQAARSFAVVGLAVATLWGPYSTMLFSHVTSGTLWIAMALACSGAARAPERARAGWISAGVLGGWTVASDYALIVPIALHLALVVPVRGWAFVALGALAPASALAAYHTVAFGSWQSIGYDHHANFEFARTRAGTFSGDPLEGLWVLLGLGHGAGVIAQAPFVVLGAIGLALERRWREGVAVAAFVGLLAFHRTPWGGASEDHRYLVPALPIVALGFAATWERWVAQAGDKGRVVALALVVLLACSAVLTWSSFFVTRDG